MTGTMQCTVNISLDCGALRCDHWNLYFSLILWNTYNLPPAALLHLREHFVCTDVIASFQALPNCIMEYHGVR